MDKGKGINLKIIEFRNAIKNFVNNSDLPDEVKRMVLEQILDEQDKKTVLVVRQEIAEREKAEAEVEDNGED